jgi:hypothetical protein
LFEAHRAAKASPSKNDPRPLYFILANASGNTLIFTSIRFETDFGITIRRAQVVRDVLGTDHHDAEMAGSQ